MLPSVRLVLVPWMTTLVRDVDSVARGRVVGVRIRAVAGLGEDRAPTDRDASGQGKTRDGLDQGLYLYAGKGGVGPADPPSTRRIMDEDLAVPAGRVRQGVGVVLVGEVGGTPVRSTRLRPARARSRLSLATTSVPPTVRLPVSISAPGASQGDAGLPGVGHAADGHAGLGIRLSNRPRGRAATGRGCRPRVGARLVRAEHDGVEAAGECDGPGLLPQGASTGLAVHQAKVTSAVSASGWPSASSTRPWVVTGPGPRGPRTGRRRGGGRGRRVRLMATPEKMQTRRPGAAPAPAARVPRRGRPPRPAPAGGRTGHWVTGGPGRGGGSPRPGSGR